MEKQNQTIDYHRQRIAKQRKRFDLEVAILETLPKTLLLYQITVFGGGEPRASIRFRFEPDEWLTSTDALMQVFKPMARCHFKHGTLSFPAIAFLAKRDLEAIDNDQVVHFPVAPFIVKAEAFSNALQYLEVNWYAKVLTSTFDYVGVHFHSEVEPIPEGWGHQIIHTETDHHGNVVSRTWEPKAPIEIDGFANFYGEGEKKPFLLFWNDHDAEFLDAFEA